PRITHPRHTTASNRPVSAARCAASGISKAPGTRTTVMSLAATPAADSASSAPACRRSVTKSWYFDTTTANRKPDARPDAWIVVIFFLWRGALFLAWGPTRGPQRGSRVADPAPTPDALGPSPSRITFTCSLRSRSCRCSHLIHLTKPPYQP